jgi:hypothetical protein
MRTMGGGALASRLMKVTMLLADAAQAVEGKLYVLGGGWSICGPDPTPTAIAVKVEVPWDQANLRHQWRLSLLDSDGTPVEADGPEGRHSIAVEGEFEVGRPPGLRPGTPIDLPLALNFGPIPLAPNSRYEWRLEIDGELQGDSRLAFSTRSTRPGPTSGQETQ